MSAFPLIIFQIFGIYPFTIANDHQILHSKHWHRWSIFLNVSIIIASIVRSVLYLDWHPEPNTIGYIYSWFTKCEPCISLTAVIPVGFIVINERQFKLSQKLMQRVFNASTKETDLLGKRVTIVALVTFIGFFRFVQTSTFGLFEKWNDIVDFWLSLAQSLLSMIWFLHFYLVLNVIIFNLNKIEEEMNFCRQKKEETITKLQDVLEMYKYFSKLYHFFVRTISFCHFFYAIMGIKHFEDLVHSESDKNLYLWNSTASIIWYFYEIPLVFMIMHQGELFHNKVKKFL